MFLAPWLTPNHCWRTEGNLLNYSACCAASGRPPLIFFLNVFAVDNTRVNNDGEDEGSLRRQGGKPHPRGYAQILLQTTAFMPLTDSNYWTALILRTGINQAKTLQTATVYISPLLQNHISQITSVSDRCLPIILPQNHIRYQWGVYKCSCLTVDWRAVTILSEENHTSDNLFSVATMKWYFRNGTFPVTQFTGAKGFTWWKEVTAL